YAALVEPDSHVGRTARVDPRGRLLARGVELQRLSALRRTRFVQRARFVASDAVRIAVRPHLQPGRYALCGQCADLLQHAGLLAGLAADLLRRLRRSVVAP